MDEMKTARELAIEESSPGKALEWERFAKKVFDTCIEVAETEASEEAVRQRYKEDDKKEGMHMARSIARQLRSLKGE